MKTQNLKKLVFLCVGFLIFSCSKSDISEADETLALEKNEVEIVENAKVETILGIAWPHGIYGPSNVDAYQNATYSVILSQAQQNTVASNKRKFKIHLQAYNPDIPDVEWRHIDTFKVPYSTVTIKFPKRGNYNTTKWRIGYQMYNKKTGTHYATYWKTVIVNN